MKSTKLFIEEFQKEQHMDRLRDIYIDEHVIAYQLHRYIESLKRYETLFGESDVEIYSAPGRSEVGGNHTDHQHGMVLATSVNLDAIAIVGYNNENIIKILSEGYDVIEISLDDLNKKEEEVGTSKALIRGVASGLKERNYEIGGFNAYITSDVLNAAGLSSSAAFETIIGTIVSGLFNQMKISMVEIAQVGQYAENIYFNKPCGLMDQMACSVGGLIHIDFRDTKKPIVNNLDVDFEAYAYSLCIVDTKGSHEDLTDDYAMIFSEMKKVATYFGKEVLREVDEDDFYMQLPKIRAQMGDRCLLRAIHFFQEEKCVENEINALRSGCFSEFLRLVKKSGNSSFKYLQNIYTDQDIQNQSVSIGLAVSESILENHGVSRVHGGGFAGTIQAFVANNFVSVYKEKMDYIYGPNACHILKVRKYGGMKVL